MHLYPKIDVYRVHRNDRGQIVCYDYLCSTNRHKRCRDAANSVREARQLGHVELIGRFDKKERI